MKFGQLIEYNLRKVFLEKSYTKRGAETIPRPFFKKSKLSISLDQYSKVLYIFVFIVCQVEHYRNWLKLSCRPLAFTWNKTFLKKANGGLELVSLSHFQHNLWRKYLSCYIFLPDQISMPGCLDFVRYWTICVL